MIEPPERDQMRLAEILLVEDSPEDVLLTRETLREAKVANRLHVADDGDDALDFLRRQGTHRDAPRPDLIILDLNLPRRDGRQVLEELKADEDLRRIPIVVLTSSASQHDILESYDKHANAYIRKPVNLEQFVNVVRLVDEHWLGIVTRAPRPHDR